MSVQRRARVLPISMLVVLGLASQACAPMFMDARPVGTGRVEMTPNISALGASFDGESEHVGNSFGVQVLGGVSDRVDVGAGYTRLQAADGGGGLNLVGFGPKIGLYNNDASGVHLAAAAPFGFAFGDGGTSDSFTFSPTFLATFPLNARVDLTPSARLFVPFCDGCETLVGFNIGVGVGDAYRRVRIRPEFGILINPGEEGVIWFFGGGVSLRR